MDNDSTGPPGSPWWSKAELERGLEQHGGVAQLASAWNVSESTLRVWRDRHGITEDEEC